MTLDYTKLLAWLCSLAFGLAFWALVILWVTS